MTEIFVFKKWIVKQNFLPDLEANVLDDVIIAKTLIFSLDYLIVTHAQLK